MFKLKKISREKTIKDEINAIVFKLTEEYTDVEIVEIVNGIKHRSLAYLKHRVEKLKNKINVIEDKIMVCQESIEKIES